MNIGITSQNFRTITGHAGKSRRFLVFRIDDQNTIPEPEHLDLPLELSMHEFRGTHHPLFELDVLIAGSCGEGLQQRLTAEGVTVITTAADDPRQTVMDYLAGRPLPPAAPHTHDHHAPHPLQVGMPK